MEAFYSHWVTEKERLLNDLLSVPLDRPDLHIPLISRALLHHAQYHDRLCQLADGNVFLALSAYWLTPFERFFFWLGGIKPNMLFRFTPLDITDDQRREIEKLKRQTVNRQAKLEALMKDAEVLMTTLMAMRTLHGHATNGEVRADAEARVISIVQTVFHDADRLRRYVVSTKLKVLNTTQAVRFLVLVMSHQISTRQFGLRHMYRFNVLL